MNDKNNKVLEKFIKESIVLIVGKQYEPIADLLNSEKHVNEFIIAKKLDVTINQARNLLYKISDHGLVSSIRKKDKKKGWYTYFWKIEVMKSLEFLKYLIIKKIEQNNGQIKSRELKQFYYCDKCGTEYTEENALLHDFTCPECGGIFALKDNSKAIKDFRKNLEKLEEELMILDQEIEKEKSKSNKKRAKDAIKVAKDNSKRKKANALLARAKRKLLAPKSKPLKKKPKRLSKKPSKKTKPKVTKKKSKKKRR